MKLIVYSGSDHKRKAILLVFLFSEIHKWQVWNKYKQGTKEPLGKHTQQHRAECLQEINHLRKNGVSGFWSNKN